MSNLSFKNRPSLQNQAKNYRVIQMEWIIFYYFLITMIWSGSYCFLIRIYFL